eukprot:m.23153 g.23153  ORF g.23153 m.23153 type:complete len:129 (-) comp14085_c0_seq1:22-408(-)
MPELEDTNWLAPRLACANSSSFSNGFSCSRYLAHVSCKVGSGNSGSFFSTAFQSYFLVDVEELALRSEHAPFRLNIVETCLHCLNDNVCGTLRIEPRLNGWFDSAYVNFGQSVCILRRVHLRVQSRPN